MIRQRFTRPVRMCCARFAAPTGGDGASWGRGCIFTVVMSVLPSLSCSNADLIAVAVPSGQPVSLLEVLLDEQPGAVWARFRFIAPGIGHDAEDVASDQAVGDMDHLCNTLALPYLRENVLEAERIVISFSDRVVAFGASDPDATQFFELYSAGPDGCVWEGF